VWWSTFGRSLTWKRELQKKSKVGCNQGKVRLLRDDAAPDERRFMV